MKIIRPRKQARGARKVIRGRIRKGIKQIIREFVNEVTVYKDHVEVKFNMAFSSHKKEMELSIKNNKVVYGFQKYAVEN
jgi:hypothetical protein